MVLQKTEQISANKPILNIKLNYKILSRIPKNFPRAKAIKMVIDKIKLSTEKYSNKILAVQSIKSD